MPYIGSRPPATALTASDIADGIVSTAKIADTAITNAKLNADIISADTALGATPADTDEFLVSDAGVLKRMDYSHIKGGGAWTFIQAQTASDSSYLEWTTSQITSTYDIYKLFAYNVHSATDSAHHYLQVDVGAGYVTSNYKYAAGQVTYSGSVNAVGSDSDSFIKLTRDSTGNATGENANYEIVIWDPLATDNWKMISTHGAVSNQDGEVLEYFGAGGYFSGQAALSKIKFYASSGNITSGDFYLYGLNKS